MNKKGDIPMILLFLAALVLIVVSLFSFASFGGKFNEDSEGRSEILEKIVFYEDYVVKESEIIGREVIINGGLLLSDEGLKERFKEVFEMNRKFEIIGLENYYGRVLRKEFNFVREGDKYVFSIEDLSLESNVFANKMIRKIGFRIEFDSNGNVIRRVRI